MECILDKSKVSSDDRLVFDIPDNTGYPLAAECLKSKHKESDDTDEIPTKSFLLALSNPKGKGISVKPLELDNNLRRCLGPEGSANNLSNMTLELVDEKDSAEAVVDPTNSYIRLTMKNRQNYTSLGPNFSSEQCQFIKVGCWN